MNVLKFKLSGKTAFFKKPDVNTFLYFTYGSIHKIAILGIFGAIVGYGGYNQLDLKKRIDKDNKEIYPEFYEKLRNLKISIEPLNEGATVNKKIQVFNNSVGYASKENGGNLIIKEQWLENPKWNIYLLLNNEEAENIAENIINNKAIYQPYLGKNDHYATISEIEILDECNKVNNVFKINSLCLREEVSLAMPEEDPFGDKSKYEEIFKYSEKLPYELNKETSLYEVRSFIFSNMDVTNIKAEDVYKVKEKNIVFF